MQGLVKYATVMICYEKLHENILKIGHIYESNGIRNTPNWFVLQRWGDYGEKMCNVVVGLFGSLGFLVFSAPIIYYLIWGISYEPMVPLLLPGVNEKEPTGYVILTTYHIGMMILAIFGSAGADILIFAYVLHMWPMCLIFSNLLTDMNNALRDPANRGSRRLSWFVRNMIQVHQEICL